ncbi:unnamed protein product [Darwinula stevensoni]|uniref:(S)-2-hydroxy-acid oxidase n=1 Tax=Darwinula stevensoni TaxID=69355 RepID=A0A7R9FQ42_9CRUS|nr:unnamed protein product [Darwinula stevensoni]CAG0898965.1 unnamed protein product [Darwinula stevensoni]
MDSNCPPVCILDFEKYAYSTLPRNALDYYRSGADHQQTLLDNRAAFQRYRLRPRVLRDVRKRDLSASILGERVSMPIGVAPTAMQRMAHPDGECANARAAESMETIFTLSTIATSSIEEVARAAPKSIKWFQVYIYKDRSMTHDLVIRAKQAGFKALVLTVDAPHFGRRLADVRNKFILPPHLRMANFNVDSKAAKQAGVSAGGSGISEYVMSMFDPSVTWKDLKWLSSISSLPIIVKGILTAEDAEEALHYNVAAILVSNHGARQVDGVPATIDVLSEVVKTVKGRCEVYLDGGITNGTDVFKALALGAKMVFVGRPMIWGLAYGGEAGARKVLQILHDEFSSTMALMGTDSFALSCMLIMQILIRKVVI